MTKVVSKGTVLSHTVGTSLAAIAQIIGFEVSGAESETYDATTLDLMDGTSTSSWKVYEPTGYSEPGEVNGTLFYDPALAGHQNFATKMSTPATQSHQVTFADSSTTTRAFKSAGVAFGYAVEMSNGLVGTFRFKLTGNPGV